MGRIKKDHSGYYSHGLYIKYKSPSANEEPIKHKSKKNTQRWCRGKVGVEHIRRRYFYHFGWTSKRTNWIRCKCIECGKELNSKSSSIPLIIELDDDDGKIYPIQVKVNGLAIPFTHCQLKSLRLEHWHWCEFCKEWH